MYVENLLNHYILPLAVIISTAGTTTTAALAWKLYQSVQHHDRALFGADDIESHEGVIRTVNRNTEKVEVNRRALVREGMVRRRDAERYRQSGPDRQDND